MELASLQGHHAGLTPSKWKSADKQPSEHHPGLPAPENHEKKEARPLLNYGQIGPRKDHQTSTSSAEEESRHGGDKDISSGSHHVMNTDKNSITAENKNDGEKDVQRHWAGCLFAESKHARHAQQKPAKAAGDLWKRLMAASPHQSHRNDGHRQKHEGFGC
jgi:hypothetical protein